MLLFLLLNGLSPLAVFLTVWSVNNVCVVCVLCLQCRCNSKNSDKLGELTNFH